ncbi:amino acid transporter [Spiractinospora alimapuensis]|uniref:LysE/ArgO family amino acid transporter n=1 Tax=Spiractinospora alimapuensis TaxID=2820884 RepID=UPI001F28AE03|nr:LysE/ArgO family amino acid transporter [Spiractinospora alimapuensis]QVQ54880.1 amino acid transporter [Spiractinospora alimapuensis]
MGLTLIVAIGAQNVFVLRQGLRREHVGVVVAICAVSDAVLILTGVAGLGRLLDTAPVLVTAATWGGAAFLCGYAVVAARRALRPGGHGLLSDDDAGPDSPASPSGPRGTLTGSRVVAVAGTTAALTWLNPHVYLDTVVFLGSIAASYGETRWWFAGGAVLASLVWFCALGFGARFLGRWLRTPTAWRALDGAIAVVMLGLAVSLVLR